MDWQDLKYVLALQRVEGFSAAARMLEVNESTVARRIARLEKTIGAKLIERGKARVFLTETGCDLAALAEQMETTIDQTTARIDGRDRQVSGRVRLTAVPILINHVIGPAVPDYLRGHKDLSVDLIAEASDMSLMRREVDLAIRLVRPQQELRAIARKIGSIPYGILHHRNHEAERLPWLDYSDEMRFLPQVTWMSDVIGGYCVVLLADNGVRKAWRKSEEAKTKPKPSFLIVPGYERLSLSYNVSF